MLDKLIDLGVVHCFGGGGGNTVTETEDQQAQADINQKLWDFYVSDYKPQIDKYSAMKTSPAIATEEKNKVAGQINADVMKNVPTGGSENSVKTARELTKIGQVATSAEIQGQGGSRSRTLSGMQNVIDIGRGQAVSADVGLGTLADQSVRTAISKANAKQLEDESTGEAFGSVAGAAAAGLLKYKKPTATV
jgi:hypothetical protein